MRAANVLAFTAFVTSGVSLVPALAHAQDASVGAGFAYGTEAEKIGLQLNGYYSLESVLENSRVGGDFTYYFVEEGLTYWEVNVNGHYFFLKQDALGVYGLAGLNVSHVGISIDTGFGSIDASNNEIGLNLGAGAEYSVTEQIGLYAELKYIISSADQAVIGLGGRYRF